ncbi:MAG: hypothetical protein PVSMB1_06790 [Gemmatimonadaceae bacterium]
MAALNLLAPDSINSPRESDLATETAHLRRLIETQPFCIMRIALDGVLLAANDAALALLGAREPDQVLGTALTVWMGAGHQDGWLEFVSAVAGGASGSLECELTGSSSNHRTVVLYGVPLLDHADGIPSMILGVRDISDSRRIEAALQASESHRLEPAPQTVEQIESQRVALEQLERLLKEGRTHLKNLRTQLQQAGSDRGRLATCLAEAESQYQRQMAEQAALSAQQQLTVAEQHERDLLLKDQDAQHRESDLHAQMDAATTEQRRLATCLEEAESVRRNITAQLSAEREEHDRVLEAATLTQTKMSKELADHRVELQSMDVGMRQLVPLAASGRLALEVGRELSKIAETMDVRAAGLLAQCPLEAASRSEIEALRSEAIQARSLVSQIPQLRADAPVPPTTAIGDSNSSNLATEQT